MASAGAALGPAPLAVLASGFVHLLASQISTRLLTFFMNLVVARHLSPEAYGLSAVQFHLLLTAILTLSREGFRRGCLRIKQSGREEGEAGIAAEAARVLSVGAIVIPIGCAVTALVCTFAATRAEAAADEPYRRAILLYGVAAVVELASEPLYLVASVRLAFSTRAAVDAVGTLARCVVTLVLVLRGSLPAATIFAVAQLCYAVVALVGYGMYGAHLARKRRLAWRLQRWGAQEIEALRMCGLFAVQSSERLALAEGSKLALVAVGSAAARGVYGLVSNLGGLLVRTLFAPFEEAAFVAFSRSAAALAAPAAAPPAGPSAKPAAPPMELQQLGRVLAVLVRAVSILGLLALTFGPAYAQPFIQVVYSDRWGASDAPRVLACYSAYIPLLAVNGITEAFVQATQSQADLRRSNWLLLLFAATHVALSTALVPSFGAAGLVAADAGNMAIRIAYSLNCIAAYFHSVPGFSLSSLFPGRDTLAACAAAAAVALASRAWLYDSSGVLAEGDHLLRAASHVAAGGACLAVLLGRLYQTERGAIQAAAGLRRGGKKD